MVALIFLFICINYIVIIGAKPGHYLIETENEKTSGNGIGKVTKALDLNNVSETGAAGGDDYSDEHVHPIF